MVCPHGQGERLRQCGHFADKGRGGQFFAILCGRLLWTGPYILCYCYNDYKILALFCYLHLFIFSFYVYGFILFFVSKLSRF